MTLTNNLLLKSSLDFSQIHIRLMGELDEREGGPSGRMDGRAKQRDEGAGLGILRGPRSRSRLSVGRAKRTVVVFEGSLLVKGFWVLLVSA